MLKRRKKKLQTTHNLTTETTINVSSLFPPCFHHEITIGTVVSYPAVPIMF